MIIEYKELVVENNTLRGFFEYPDDGKYTNICVMLHGYTGHKNENCFLFKELRNELIDAKIAVLRFDYYGSGDSDGMFENQTFDTVLKDAEGILKCGYELNNNKPVYLLGFSMGGAAASRMSVKFADLIEKLVLISPAGCMASNTMRTFTNNPVVDGKYVDLGGFYVTKEYMESFQNKDLYEGCGNFTKPTLITQGTIDQSVPPEYSRKYHDLYKNSEYYLIEGAPHGYNKVPFRKELMKKIVSFLK